MITSSYSNDNFFVRLIQAQRVLQAATWDWQSDNGAATGSPAKGTRNTGRTEYNWKNVDDVATAYSSSPVTAGNNSFEIYGFGKYTGTFNQILSVLFAHTSTNFNGTSLIIKGPPSAPNTYIFTITSGNATAGATYTNNSQTFTVLETIAGGTTLVTSGTGGPLASGTLTKATGTGDATLTFSAFGQSGLHYATPSTTANASLTTDMSTAIAIGSGITVWVGPTGPEASGKAASTTSNPAYTSYLVTQLQTTSGAPPGDTPTATFTCQYLEN